MNEIAVLAALDAMCQFKIGSTVYTKVSVALIAPGPKKKRHMTDPQPLQVIERHITQCYGGVQVNYILRAHVTDRWQGAVGFSSELQRMVEIELTDVLPVWPEPETKSDE